MTTLMNQVKIALYNMKTGESKRNEHLVSINQSEFCKYVNDKIAIKFSEIISNACPEKSKIKNIKSEKTHDFWQLHFSTKLPKGKSDKLCSDSNKNSELEGSI